MTAIRDKLLTGTDADRTVWLTNAERWLKVSDKGKALWKSWGMPQRFDIIAIFGICYEKPTVTNCVALYDELKQLTDTDNG